MSRRTQWAAGLVVMALAVGVGVVSLGSQDQASAQETGAETEDGAAETAESTSEVRRQTLRSSDEFNGDLGFGDTRELVSGADGVITWLPEDDCVIVPGDVIWEINRQPVPYLDGAIPMYRDLFWGATKGDDILQLETLLVELGHGPENWVPDNSFNRTTRNAVKELQRAYGMTDNGALGQTEVVFGTAPLRVANAAHVGDATNNGPILTVTDAIADVTVDTTSRQLATFQNAPDVVIVLADGRELDATIDEIKATPADDQGRFGYRVTYVVADEVGQAQPVKVRIEQMLAEDALTVPVDALIALTEGGYAVEVATPSGNVLRAVEVIDFDDTNVAITADLAEGDLVVVP